MPIIYLSVKLASITGLSASIIKSLYIKVRSPLQMFSIKSINQ